MDRLQGYGTDGHEYRMSQIDRSNSNRLKWMLDEAKKNLEKKDKAQNNENLNLKQVKDKNIDNKFINSISSKANERIPKDNMFHPDSINKLKNFNIYNKFNNK